VKVNPEGVLAYKRQTTDGVKPGLGGGLPGEAREKQALLPAALYLFARGDYEQALDLLVGCYSHEGQTATEKEHLLQFILAAYYEPNVPQFKEIYTRNLCALAAYEHNYLGALPTFDTLPYICIPRNERSFYLFHKESACFRAQITIGSEAVSWQGIGKNECVLAINIFDFPRLEALHWQTFHPLFNGMKVPMYLIWADELQLLGHLQVVDYTPLIATGRFVFFRDYTGSAFNNFFHDDQAILPKKVVGETVQANAVRVAVAAVAASREREAARAYEDVAALSRERDRRYYLNLLRRGGGKVRVLFVTSRFTTVLQYCIRDCLAAARELGYVCDLLIERSDLHRMFPGSWWRKIAAFKPDIIFQIDHFGWEYGVPEGFLYVTWVQDPLPHIFSKDAAEKLRPNDLILAMTKTFREKLAALGYPGKKILHQPMAVNPEIYYPRDVMPEERARYAADITYISHVGDPEGRLIRFAAEYTSQFADAGLREKFVCLLRVAYEITRKRIEQGLPAFTDRDYKLILEEAAGLVGIHFDVPDSFACEFGHWVGNPLHRSIPLTWLSASGYALKLWGNEWDRNRWLKKYAMGLARNGEELAKILSCSKITLGLQHQTTMHPRALEAMACGSLYICKHLPPEYDYDNLRQYFTEGEDFICFYNREDLLRKVDFYLKNEDERRRIAENGRKKVLREHTYRRVMENCFGFIKAVIEGEVS